MPQMMPTTQQNTNILSGLTQDVLKKVTKNITDTVSAHATDALQQGVPFGHVLDSLLKMSPLAMGLDLMSHGGQGGIQDMGGYKPPQGPTPAVKNDQQAAPPPQSNDLTQAVLAQPGPAAPASPQVPQLLPAKGMMQGASIDANGNVSQQGMGMQILHNILPAFFPGGLSTSEAIQAQVGLGKTPRGQLSQKISEAISVPPDQYQTKTLQAAGYTALLDNAKNDLASINQEAERATSNFNAMLNSRSWLGKAVPGGAGNMVKEFKTNLDDISKRRDEAQQRLIDLYGQHPNLKKADAMSSKDLIGKNVGKYKIVSVQ